MDQYPGEGEQSEAETVAIGKQRSFHLSIKDDQLLAELRIFYDQIRTAECQI